MSRPSSFKYSRVVLQSVRYAPHSRHRLRFGTFGSSQLGQVSTGTNSPSGVPIPTVKIFIPCAPANSAAFTASGSCSSPSVKITNTLWRSISSSPNISSAVLMAAAMLVPPCGMTSTCTKSTCCRSASWSTVNGHCKNATPAKGTSAKRSPSPSLSKSRAASLARTIREGARSLANMLREVSMAITTSRLVARLSNSRNPQRGPDSAAMRQPIAASNPAARSH